MKPKFKMYKTGPRTWGITISGINGYLWDPRAIAFKIEDQLKDFRCVGGIPMRNIFNILDIREWVPRCIKSSTVDLEFTDKSDIEIFQNAIVITGIERHKKAGYESTCDHELHWNVDYGRSRKLFMDYILHGKPTFSVPMSIPEKVIFHDPATIVYWKDGTKTVVKCGPNDTYSKETGLALCYMKKVLGNKGNYNNVFRKWIKGDDANG